MTDTEQISSWFKKPNSLNNDSKALLSRLKAEFHYCKPLQYLDLAAHYQYKSAPLNSVQELYPINPVLIYELFNGKIPEKTSSKPIEEKQQPEAFTDKELKAAATTQDYFASQGIHVDKDLPTEIIAENKPNETPQTEEDVSEEKELMVVMSFSEWLRYFKERNEKAKEEEAGKSALRAMWQKQKLAAVIEEEEEEIPEEVFKMAVDSVTEKEEIVNESMARVYAMQGKKEKALEVYQKLSLLNPEKSAYFAKKIENLKKEIDI